MDMHIYFGKTNINIVIRLKHTAKPSLHSFRCECLLCLLTPSPIDPLTWPGLAKHLQGFVVKTTVLKTNMKNEVIA